MRTLTTAAIPAAISAVKCAESSRREALITGNQRGGWTPSDLQSVFEPIAPDADSADQFDHLAVCYGCAILRSDVRVNVQVERGVGVGSRVGLVTAQDGLALRLKL